MLAYKNNLIHWSKSPLYYIFYIKQVRFIILFGKIKIRSKSDKYFL